jgi:uncharacterized protein YecE (DUF72 family)
VTRSGRLRVGTSGWQYRHWRGVFYPPDLPVARWLDYYAARFDTVEVNNTFYHLPEPSAFDAWRARAPRGFCYALKFSRFATHLKRLREPAEPIARFLAGARRLGPCLGPILVQLPPRWRADPARLDAFLAAAPRGRRWAVEFRDPRWLVPDVYAVLRRHRAALCVHDLLPDHPRERTARWTYLRFHGVAYGGAYAPARLRAEAVRIRRDLAAGIDVYAYFNNDVGGYAVTDALALRACVG